jgi:hypothetical protein
MRKIAVGLIVTIVALVLSTGVAVGESKPVVSLSEVIGRLSASHEAALTSKGSE